MPVLKFVMDDGAQDIGKILDVGIPLGIQVLDMQMDLVRFLSEAFLHSGHDVVGPDEPRMVGMQDENVFLAAIPRRGKPREQGSEEKDENGKRKMENSISDAFARKQKE